MPLLARMRPALRQTVVVLAALAAVLIHGAQTPAYSASINAITGITTTWAGSPSAPLHPGMTVTTQITWCVPDGSHAGDTFSVTMPAQLANFPSGTQTVLDGTGAAIGTATIAGQPAVVTYTMGAYVETHTGVCGQTTISAQLSTDNNGAQDLVYTTNAGVTFTTPIVVEPWPPRNPANAEKYGLIYTGTAFPDTNIVWVMHTPASTTATTATFTDTAQAGQAFNCAAFVPGLALPYSTDPASTIAQQNLDTATNTLGNDVTYTGTATLNSCTPSGISVTVTVPANTSVGLILPVTITDNTLKQFSDTVVVAMGNGTSQNAGTSLDNPNWNNSGGGNNLSIVKFSTDEGPTNGDHNTAPGKSVPAGTPTPVTMTVRNNGSLVLSNVEVTDSTTSGPALTGLSCDFSPLGGPATGTTWAGPFVPGATFDCTGTIPAMEPGTQETDTSTVTATTTAGVTVTASDSFNAATPPSTPALSIAKSVSPTTVSAAGQTVTYSFVVTNTGNVDLTNIGVTETQFSGTGTSPTATCPATTLTPGTSTTCTATYTVTQADIDAGTVTNTATAHGTPPSGPPATSPPATARITATSTPALTIAKSVSPTTVSTEGETVTYSYLVINTGNVDLTDIGVTETQFSGTGTSPTATCPATTLTPGTSTTCTATYTVTQADIDAGTVTNTATAHGTPPSGPPATSPPATARITATSTPAPLPTQPPKHPNELPNTGAEELLYATGATLLVGLGTLALVSARATRRRPRPRSGRQ
ncbi:Ig-like domain-containing protein [Kitasatospora sp. NPDC006786]|uniref:DUF7507 domain-containing protein n=1 Tax=unclassified Kitasatospora TaxID=2633591 RepID=UPI0033F0C56A